MKRKSYLYKSAEFVSRHVHIDAEAAPDILAFLANEKHRKKFDYIVNRILNQNFIYFEEYENLTGYKDISEMRIFPNGINARIYCKEVKGEKGNFYIIAAKLLGKKKPEKIDKKINQFIKPIEDYEYDL